MNLRMTEFICYDSARVASIYTDNKGSRGIVLPPTSKLVTLRNGSDWSVLISSTLFVEQVRACLPYQSLSCRRIGEVGGLIGAVALECLLIDYDRDVIFLVYVSVLVDVEGRVI